MKIKSFKNQRLTALIAIFLFAISACSSDETNQANNNPMDASSSSDIDENGDSDAHESPDSDLSDAVFGGNDVNPNQDTGTNTDKDVDSGVKTDVVEPDPDEYPVVEPVACAFPSTDESCVPGNFGAGTFLTEFQIVEDKSCCYDFNGNGKLDNFLGSLVGTISAFPAFGDVNANIRTAISLGELVYLFEYSDLEHPEFDSDFKLTLFEGRDTDLDFGPNLVGAGDFNLLPHSYEMPGVPKWAFEKARVHNGELLATGGRLRIRFPGMLDEIVMILEKVRVRAKIVQEAGKAPDLKAGGRVWLTQGELAGALNRDTLFSSLNDAAKGCECIQDVDAIYAYNSTNDIYSCAITSADAGRCRSASPECQNLADQNICRLLALQSSKVDVDTDNDGKPDAFSFGARFTGVGASIIGIADGNTP